MELILGGINGKYLRQIVDNGAGATERVDAAVAYANDTTLLFDWCLKHRIPLRFYGRLDEKVAVSTPILEKFINTKSPAYVCKLVKHHHAKVIWWHGLGLYIGSANLTGSAWYKNVEAGCYFPDDEITDDIARDITRMFSILDKHSTPLTEELLSVMKGQVTALKVINASAERASEDFWKSPSISDWSGLGTISPKAAEDHRRDEFLKEWHSTLQQLRDIGDKVSDPDNRPAWVKQNSPTGTQADQFLHAHYYNRTFVANRATYLELFEKNRMHPDKALDDAISWWRSLKQSPGTEQEMLDVTAPALRRCLDATNLPKMEYDDFHAVCLGVHAIRDYSRRVRNRAVNLPEGKRYSVPEKVAALSRRIWDDRSDGGRTVKDLIAHILYGGPTASLPERLWEGIANPAWKIEGLGVSALGELVGWALPEKFPPRNGRTSKALKSLGYDVMIHVD